MAVTIDGTNGITSPDFEPSGSTVPTNGLFLPTTNALGFATNSTERLRLDASGNLGLGVTPSAWSGKALQVGSGASIFTNSIANAFILSNAYYDGSNFRYVNSSTATYYSQNSGVGNHVWSVAVSGTAGAAISFTQAMTLDASGNLGIGVTNPSFALDIASTSASRIRLTASTGVNSAYLQLVNNGGNYYIGADNSGGSLTGSPGAAYSLNMMAVGAYPIIFSTSAAERARIDSSGNLLVGTTTSSGYGGRHRITLPSISQGTLYLSVDGGAEYSAAFQAVTSGGYSVNSAAQWVGKNSTNSRSINAGGTINASGADYAEYMVKAGDFELAKGDVCGVDANGLLTNMFSDAVSFVVKSTDPSYVGNDSWGVGFKDDPEGLEIARQKVDRIAFAGQVPVNVFGAKAGDYIIPVADKKGIKGEAVSNPTFEQYQIAVGKVIAIESDGRAKIIVKVA